MNEREVLVTDSECEMGREEDIVGKERKERNESREKRTVWETH
jgi:hypothetical protein